ncbi:MAG TPA: DivIVA domain-containing protein, partial [Acidimicrobiales bacterium]|nr:DivIVA domain-containing protein [Acidimicrobiales bacterium]
ASPEQPRVSEELGHAVSALEELVTEVRSTSDQNRDSAAMLRELVGAVSEYGVHLRSHTAVMRNLAVTTDQLQEAASRLADAMTSPTAQLRPAGPQRPQRHLGTTQRRPEAFETSRTPLGTSRMDPDAQLWREPFSAADLRWPNLPRTAGGYFTEPVNRLLDRAADALELVERERNSMRERLLVVETRLAILTQQQQASTQQRISAQRDAFELDARERHDAMLALQEASRRASDIVREIEDERTRLLEIARELGVQLLAAGRSFGEAAANEVVPERPSTTPAQAPLPSRRSAGPAVAPSAPTSAPVGPPLPWVPATTPAPSRPGATSPPGGSPGGSSAAPSADGGVHAPGPGMPPVWEVTPPPTR